MRRETLLLICVTAMGVMNLMPWGGPTIDARWTPRSSLLTHIGGSSWVVNYYAQVLDKDSNLSGQQYTKNPVYQSYKKIVNLEIKVQTPLNTDQDDANKEMNVTGSGTLYPSVIPNEGDMFLADIGEGRKAVFRITSSRKNSIFKEACYDISYTLDTDNIDKQLDLEQKTIVTYYFHKDFLINGNNPLVIKSDMDTLVNLKKVYDIMLYQYFKRFYSNEFKTLIKQAQLDYDTAENLCQKIQGLKMMYFFVVHEKDLSAIMNKMINGAKKVSSDNGFFIKIY
jgi:hypothetical protein